MKKIRAELTSMGVDPKAECRGLTLTLTLTLTLALILTLNLTLTLTLTEGRVPRLHGEGRVHRRAVQAPRRRPLSASRLRWPPRRGGVSAPRAGRRRRGRPGGGGRGVGWGTGGAEARESSVAWGGSQSREPAAVRLQGACGCRARARSSLDRTRTCAVGVLGSVLIDCEFSRGQRDLQVQGSKESNITTSITTTTVCFG